MQLSLLINLLHPTPNPSIQLPSPHTPPSSFTPIQSITQFLLHLQHHSRTPPPPLPTKPRQPALPRPKPNHRALGEEKRIPLLRIHLLLHHIRPLGVFELGDLHVAFEQDLHFVVGVGVDEFGAGEEAVESGGDGGGGVVAVFWVGEDGLAWLGEEKGGGGVGCCLLKLSRGGELDRC